MISADFNDNTIPDYLDWDSRLFGLKVGKINIQKQSAHNLNKIITNSRHLKFDLLYIFTDNELKRLDCGNRDYKILLVDKKRVYSHNITSINHNTNNYIRFFSYLDDINELYNLSYQSGEFSRFKYDKNIDDFTFHQLYQHWVNNSVSGGVADAVFVWQEDGDIMGFITVKKEMNVGVIGLLAADVNHRGKAIGSALVNEAKKFIFQSGIQQIEVTTQARNIIACNFYVKNNFVLINETYVYHAWI